MEGAEELDTNGKGTGSEGRQTTGLGDVLQGGGSDGSSVQVRDVVDDTPNGQGPGKFPTQGRQADYREADKVTRGWELILPTDGYSNGGGGV